MISFSCQNPGKGLDLELSCDNLNENHKYPKYSRKGSMLKDRAYHHFPTEEIEHPVGAKYETLTPTHVWDGGDWVELPKSQRPPVSRSFCEFWATPDPDENGIRCRFLACVSCNACKKQDFLNCERQDIVGPWYFCPFVEKPVKEKKEK